MVQGGWERWEKRGILGSKQQRGALAGVAQWIECQPVKLRVAGSIARQGTCLGYRPGPWLGGTREATTH